VIAAAGGVAALGILGATGYWAFLDSHQYLEVRGDNLALIHGYPGLSGFGLPRDDWIYAEGPNSIREGSHPKHGEPLVFDRSRSPERLLLDVLKPAARARIRWRLNDKEGARADLLDAAAAGNLAEENAFELLPKVVRADDEARLEQLVRSLKPTDSWHVVLALKTLNPSRAVVAFRASPAAENLGIHLNLLAAWEGICTSEIQNWFSGILSQPGAIYAYPPVTQAVLRTRGCVFPLDRALDAPANYVREALYAVRLTDKDGTKRLLQTVTGMLSDETSPVRQSRARRSRLASFWRHLGSGSCGDWLLQPGLELESDALLDAGVAAARDCNQARLVANAETPELTVIFRREGIADRVLTRIKLEPSLGASVVPVIDALLEGNAEGVPAALIAVMNATRNADLRLVVAQKLRLLGVQTHDAFAYRLPGRPDLDRELLRWLARSNPAAAAEACANAIVSESTDSMLLSTLAFIEIGDEVKARLREHAAAQGSIPRAILLTLVGHTEEIADLLVSSDPRVRSIASQYLLARDDHMAVLSTARQKSQRADRFVDQGIAGAERLANLGLELAAMPDWAVTWRARWIDHSEIGDAGLALAFERLLDRRLAGPR
jgi:hypothetical protein